MYTRAEAEALIGPLTRAIDTLREAGAVLADDDLVEHLARHAPHNGGGAQARRLAEAALRFGAALGRIQEWQVVVRDAHTGICDFPGRVEGRDVWLCWRHGEDRVAWWHDLDAGFAGRRPLAE